MMGKTSEQWQPLNLMLTFPRCLRILNWWQSSDTSQFSFFLSLSLCLYLFSHWCVPCIANYKTCHTLKTLSLLSVDVCVYVCVCICCFFLRAFRTIENDDDDDSGRQNATPTHMRYETEAVAEEPEERGQRLHENINGIGKCQANSSYMLMIMSSVSHTI